MGKNKKPLGFFHLSALGVNAIIGAGIFLIPGTVDYLLGGLAPFLYLLCALLLGSIAFCFAQLSHRTGRSGGPYIYAKMAFRGEIAFFVGWICWITAITSCGAVARALPVYVGFFLPQAATPFFSSFLAASIIIFFGALNALGVKWGGRLMAFLTILKLVPLLFLIAFGLTQVSLAHLQNIPEELSFSRVWLALSLVLFATQGFEVVPVLASESRKPKSHIAWAILTSLAFAAILYFFLQICYSGIPEVLSGSDRPLTDLAHVIMPQSGSTLVAAAGIISILGFIAGVVLGAPWYLVPLAEDEMLPNQIQVRHKRFKTPLLAIALSSLFAAVLAFVIQLTELIILSSLAVVIQYGFSALALLVLLRRESVGYRKWILPILALSICLLILSMAPAREWVILLFLGGMGFLIKGFFQKPIKQ